MSGGVTVAGLPDSRKTPGIFLAVLLGGAASSAGAAPKKILLLGNKVTTAITGSAPTLSVAAGTQANAAPVFLPSSDDAATFFGRGSEIHRMALAAFAQYPTALVYGVSAAESAGAQADGVLTFAVTSTSAFTVRLTLNAKVIDVAIASGSTPTVVGTAVATAICNEPDLPMTAQFSAGVVTLTAKHTGPRGNNLAVRAQFIDSNGTATEITTSSTTSSGATTGIWSSVTAVESTLFLDGGTTADDVSAALASIASTKYDRIVSAQRDATNVDLIIAQVDSLASVTSQLRQQAIYGSLASLATVTTLATGRNDNRGQCVWHYNSPLSAEECAAQVAAARLIGDALIGGSRVGESSRPNANLDGIELATVPAQWFVGEQPTSTEIESALNNGITPLALSVNNPGGAVIVRSITTHSLTNGVPNYSVIDTSTVTTCDYVADDQQSDLGIVFAGVNLASNTSDGSPPTAANTVTPSMIKARIAYKLATYEEAGILRNVAQNMPLLAVVENGASPGRVDCDIPCQPATPLHIVGGNVRQVS